MTKRLHFEPERGFLIDLHMFHILRLSENIDYQTLMLII